MGTSLLIMIIVLAILMGLMGISLLAAHLVNKR
jgi:hypothetical protein